MGKYAFLNVLKVLQHTVNLAKLLKYCPRFFLENHCGVDCSTEMMISDVEPFLP